MIGIKVQNLRKRLRANQALDGVSTELGPGMIHGLIGPDGAGKTTLVRTLMGFYKPDSGSVVYEEDGRPVDFKRVRPSMAYMPQSQSLYPDLSCQEHLDFFGDLYRIPRDLYQKRSGELLAMTRMTPFRERKAGQLSGGMYKKLGLMCALLQSPSVLLLDEPTTGVDPISRREFWGLLYRLVETKILILISTAYMDEAERCARVHLLEEGKLIMSGEPRELLKKEGCHDFEQLYLKRAGVAL